MIPHLVNIRADLYRYFIVKTNNSEDSNDLSQEVLLKLVKSSTSLPSIQNLRAWVFSVARNTLIDHYRKRKLPLEDLHQPDLSAIPADAAFEDLSASLLSCQKSFLESLDEQTRFLIRKADIEGISQKELALQTKLNYTTVRSKIQRGRAQLKKMFLDVCEMEYDAAGRVMGCTHKNTCNSGC